jgi:hypothetical protein
MTAAGAAINLPLILEASTNMLIWCPAQTDPLKMPCLTSMRRALG